METSAIDPAAYAAVKDTMGEIFGEVIETFLDYLPGQISKLGDAIESSDSTDVFNLAHGIKSSSGSIGALGLASTAEQIELLGRQSVTDGIDLHFKTLQNQFQEVVEFLQQDNAT